MYGVSIDSVRTMRYGGGIPKKKYTAKGIAEQTNFSMEKKRL